MLINSRKCVRKLRQSLISTYFCSRYQLSDGQEREETGEVKKSVISIVGFYKFVGTDNKIYRVDYVADEKGFRPKISQSLNENDNTTFDIGDRIDPQVIKTLVGR